VERLARSEAQARSRAEDADQRKNGFLAMLAHELRNPLAAINLALALMQKNEGDPVKVTRQRELCVRQVATLVRLVDDLLDVSRITHGKVELRKEAVDLAAVVRHALQTTRPLIDARQHELSVTTAAGPLGLDGDPTRLEQVVTNLISNAAKYTPPGGQISVRLTREENAGERWAVLRVKDSGRGLPADALERIFEPFTQLDTTLDRSAGGLGVGLTLVRQLVTLHEGTVTAHSDGPGKGSEFIVRLPLGTRLAGGRADGARPTVTSARRRVLLVEDNEDIRESTRELIEGLGHEVRVATNGLEGVEWVKASKPDVVLIDLGLPGIDGYEVARRIRGELGNTAPRLVALTGYGDPSARARSAAAGFDAHFVKPFSEEGLTKALDGEGAT
jgi:CheY-like chemotaxis protein